ncbi:MAG TPA: tetratricopeptide repeat-containing glycosyltransferase family protein [Tepidisphaeraceae bacterium]|nr:tetratricopeptide repeat-containing glycosyltransferase family protein [Tepidisphaeraceae bacterium]
MSIATPGSPGWHNDRGNALCDEFRFEEAIAEYRRAIELAPRFAEAYSNLGTALRDSGEIDAAIYAYERAIEMRPDLAEAFNNLAITRRDKGELDEALRCCRQAIAIKPNYADAISNLGVILCDLERGDEAITACRQAVELQPNRAVVQNNLGMILLKLGQYEEGWVRHECRYLCDPRYPARKLPKPRWDGSQLNGQTVLVHAEQGFGDTIQFVRYAPLIAERGGKVVLECQPELRRLFETLPNVQRVVTVGEALPDFNLHCPTMSLPFAFGTTIDSIPAAPYIRANEIRVEYWRQRLLTEAPHIHDGPHKKKIGLVWAGKPTHTNDHNRSMKFSDIAPIICPGAIFYSLQKGPAARQANGLIDYTSEFHDFAETAAFISNLDLVISVDTAVAHLAGAMGKPAWLLLPKVSEWRWMIGRPDSPWYPTMRLFRQEKWGDWTEPVKEIARLLCQGF